MKLIHSELGPVTFHFESVTLPPSHLTTLVQPKGLLTMEFCIEMMDFHFGAKMHFGLKCNR